MSYTFSDSTTDLLDQLNRPSSEMLATCKREINKVLVWMQRKHMFQFSERLATITYPANTLTVNLAAVCGGRPRDYINAQVLATPTDVSGRPLAIRRYSEIIARKDKINRLQTPEPYSTMDEAINGNSTSFDRDLRIYADNCLFLTGENLGYFAQPQSDRFILLNLHIWLAPLVEDNDTNFLLENCYDFIILKALRRMNILLKEEQRTMITDAELQEGWDSCTHWDGQVMSTPPPTI